MNIVWPLQRQSCVSSDELRAQFVYEQSTAMENGENGRKGNVTGCLFPYMFNFLCFSVFDIYKEDIHFQNCKK